MAENHRHLASTIDDKDIYKNVLDTRNFEIGLFWQRSNYFLILNSALALGFFNLRTHWYEYWLALFGILTSVLWFFVNLGSKFWQSRWEQSLSEIETIIAPDLKLFAADPGTTSDAARKSIANNQHRYWWQHLLDTLVLAQWKPSVSTCMMLLSVSFIIGWLVLLVSSVVLK